MRVEGKTWREHVEKDVAVLEEVTGGGKENAKEESTMVEVVPADIHAVAKCEEKTTGKALERCSHHHFHLRRHHHRQRWNRPNEWEKEVVETPVRKKGKPVEGRQSQ